MEFDGFGHYEVDGVDSLEDHVARFAGESEDEVKADVDAALVGHIDRVDGALPSVATVDELEGGVVGRFGTVFNYYAVVAVDVGESVEELW